MEGFGHFHNDAANVAFQRACKRLTPPLTHVRLYDLRHSFAEMMYRVTHDLATTARFLLHASTMMTERYAHGASADVDLHAIQAVDAWVTGQKVAHESRPHGNDNK